MSDKRRRGAKNRLAEIQKPRGYERGLELDEIVGATDYSGDLMYLIRWENCDELDLLPAEEVNEKSPQGVIQFYEKRSTLHAKTRDRAAVNKPIVEQVGPSTVIKASPADEESVADDAAPAMEVDVAPETTE